MSRRSLIVGYGLLLVAWCYVAASSLVAVQATTDLTRDLTHPARILLDLTILLPILAIWLVAFHGAAALGRYAALTTGSPEERGLAAIARGLLWLVAYLVLISVLGTTIQTFAHHPARDLLVTIKNHALVATSLIGFGLLYYGSYQLKRAAHFKVWNCSALWLLVAVSLAAALFVWSFVMSDATVDREGIPLYVLPKATLLFSFILPCIFGWFLGLLAGLNIAHYAQTVKGSLYRRALRQLVWGLIALVASSVIIQILGLAAIVVSSLNLAFTLLLVYGLLLCYGLAFWLVRAGARQLMRLEGTS